MRFKKYLTENGINMKYRHLRKFRHLYEQEIPFCYENLNEILNNLDPKRCKETNNYLLDCINKNVAGEDFSRVYIDPDSAEYLIKLLKQEGVHIEDKLYDEKPHSTGSYISWNVKIYNPSEELTQENVEAALDDINTIANVALMGRSGGHLVLLDTGSTGQGMFELANPDKPEQDFLRFFDLFHDYNESYLEDICDNYHSIYNMLKCELGDNILYDEFGSNDEWLSHAFGCPVVLDSDFIKMIKAVDNKVKRYMKLFTK